MRGHHPYPSYALSGVEWIGDLPSHWQVLRLRYACDLNPTKAEIKGIPSDTLVTFLPMEKIG
ncbi:MAG: restriction endonuclease subunit S, partial [Candidatus Competibacteraceae bacterium]|nr:restriction endonuclease subunit S [Candidatus Competibacteraceae bacterium]